MKKEKTEKWEKELRSYLKDKFTGILAREKWDMDDIRDVLDLVKELLQSEREEWEKEKIIIPKGKTHLIHDRCETCVEVGREEEREKLSEKIEEIIDDNNDLLRWQKEELKDEIKKN